MKKGLTIILIGIVLLAAGLGGLSIANTIASTREFVSDGYILAPAEETVVSGDVCKQVYFSKGTKYREKYDERVEFENQAGGKVSLSTEQFLHFADGSLGSFTKGVLLNVQDIDLEQLGYYSITKNTVLTKNGNNYEMSSRGEQMNLSEFVWKISDTDYMLVSSNVSLHLGNSSQINLPGYAQIKFIDSGIVRVIHEQGTYQTVSADTYLSTDSGAELNLSSKNFYVSGEKVLALDSMAIDDNTYVEIDENLDSPQLKIPTFKVINGKNGAAGIAGEDGEDGEEGEAGENGLQGENGLEGADGGDGGAGAAGAEGDSGLMGYDGAPGLDGEDAQTAGGSDIVPVDLNARPTITMNAMGDGGEATDTYDVTSSTAKMTLNMDPNESLVSGTTKVTLYDRATMKEINTVDNQEYLGSLLESGSAALNFSGLQADREYMVVVSGDYQVAEGEEAIRGTFFTKVFKTDAMGVVLEKKAVTDSSVSVKTTVTASNVDNYNVEFYHYDENGAKQVLATYYNLSTAQESLVLSDTEPAANRNGIFTMQSNYTYYAKLTGVVASNVGVNADDSVVELKTLRRKPHKESAPDVSVTAMVPTLTPNNRNRSMIMELEKLADPDNGITGYRYELLDSAEVAAAAASGTLADLVPVYSKTSDKLAPQTFSIREGDLRAFVGRVIVLFDDNEKSVEYATSLSTAASVDDSASDLTVEFLHVNKTAANDGRFDRLEGFIKVSDNTDDLANSTLLQYISTDYPMTLTITGEYEDVYTIKFENTNGATKEDGFWLFPFSKDGLRANATYTLVVHGPCETDMLPNLSEAEKNTYLAGMRGVTPGVVPLSLVSYSVNIPSTAFARAINLTRPVLTASDAPAEYYEYEASAISSIEFGLFYVDGSGVERQIGNNAKLTDSNNANHGSDFYDSAWVSRDVVTATADGLTVDVMNGANTNAEAKGFVLTPKSFGLDNNDAIFFAGGSFYIRALGATDYSEQNVIPFKESEDKIIFTIGKRHVQALNPNLQVDVTLIPNEGAQSTYGRTDLAADTIVGMRLYADYPYADIKELRYYIYELDNSDPTTAVLDGADGSASKLFYPENAVNVTGEKGLGQLVLIGTKKGGNDGGWTAASTDLYFEGTRTPDSMITWTKADGSAVTGQNVLERGKRYYVRYEVTADAGQVDCNGDGVDDVYPNCAYVGDVPYYRSAVLELAKQQPLVERYPGSSTATSYTWNYRIVDPDNAVVRDAANKVQLVVNEYSSVESAAAATGAVATNNKEIELSPTGVNADAFSKVVVDGTAGRYHTISVPYQLNESVAAEYLVSAPTLIKATQSDIGTIRAQGLLATAGTPIGDQVSIGGTIYEKALVNEGGYRFRLTLRGDGIRNCAALQVTVSGTTDGGVTHTAVYDPVYFEVIGDVTEGSVTEAYAYAYLDASPLKALKEAGVTSANVTVTGYYSTGETAMDQFLSVKADYSDKSLEGEALFAVKKINAAGLETYLSWSGGKMNDITNGTLNGSLVVPGIVTGSGLNVTKGTGSMGSMAELTMRWPLTALSVSADALDINSKCKRTVALDMNGLNELSNYYSVEKLAESGAITFADSSATIAVNDILPAVKRDTITEGARSVFMEMEAVGAGAQADSSIYARISQVTGAYTTLLKLEQKTEEGVTYYQVVENVTATPDDYSKANFGNNKLPIRTEGNRIMTDVRIRGLNMNTQYQVIFFSYDSAGNMMDLFSVDGQRIGYPYVVNTLSSIQIDVKQPDYSYTSYANKAANVRFAIPGDEGTGMQIKYEVFAGMDVSGTVVATGEVAPLGSSGYQYYSQDASKNNPVSVGMNPGTGPLTLGTGYTVRVYAVDTEAGTELGSNTLTFTTPGQLQAPTFMVQTSQKKVENDSTQTIISARVVSTDSNRSILQDQYTLTLYRVDTTNGLVEVEKRTVTRNAQNTDTRSIDFTSVAKGYSYVVKLLANIDTTNDGAADNAVEQEFTIAASSNSSATIGASATKTQLTLAFDNTQSFTQVTSIVVTAFDSNATQVYSTTITDGPFVTTDPGSFTKVLDWGTSTERADGWYTLQLQYRDGVGNVLGNNEAMVQVGGNTATGTAALGLLVLGK